jgi:AraC-like DNA-binding protein
MIAKDFAPSPQLASYISQYRVRHFVFNNRSRPGFKPFPPRPEQCVVFYPKGMEVTEYARTGQRLSIPRSVVSGQLTERINRYVSTPEFLMISADLHPGSLFRLTGIASAAFTNQYVDAEAVFSTGIREVNERLAEQTDYAQMIDVIDTFFLQLLRKQKKEVIPLDAVIQHAMSEGDNWSIDHLARQSFLSPRQMERKFYERTGVCPKMFLRITRFNRSYWMRLKKPQLSWFSIAIACGYSDYQHLVKDYKEFANTTPTAFFLEEQKAPGRVLGLTR